VFQLLGVPVASMPSGLRWFAEHQPVTAMVDAVRSVCLGDSGTALLGASTAHLVWVALVWTVVILAVAAPLAVVRFARR
jgi:ABC-2 type transport system permease protein